MVKNFVSMWWQSEFYKESQIRKTTPLTDDDKKQGVISRGTINTQFPKNLRIGLMVSRFCPMKALEFEVNKVMWLLEYYNMNGAPPFSDIERDLPRVKVFDCIEGVLNELNDIIASGEYQPSKFMEVVIENLCTNNNFKEIDKMATLENVYGVENSSELKRSVIAWLLGVNYDCVDDVINQIRECQKSSKDWVELLTTNNRDNILIHIKTIENLIKMV